MTKDPKSATLLAARLARAYPSLSAYSAATLAEELCAIERAQRRHAKRCCSGVDGGYVRRIPTGYASGNGGNITSQWNSHAIVHDPDAEERAGKRIHSRKAAWSARLQEIHGKRCPRCAARFTTNVPGAAKVDFDGRCTDCRCTFFGVSDCYKPIVELHNDPRGAVLKVRLPGEAEAVAV